MSKKKDLPDEKMSTEELSTGIANWLKSVKRLPDGYNYDESSSSEEDSDEYESDVEEPRMDIGKFDNINNWLLVTNTTRNTGNPNRRSMDVSKLVTNTRRNTGNLNRRSMDVSKLAPNTRHNTGDSVRNSMDVSKILAKYKNLKADPYAKSHSRTFVVEDPFVEVKDEEIDHAEETFEDEPKIIHLRNGYVVCGKIRKKRRCGYGSLSGKPLEEKGIKSIWGKYRAGVLEGLGKVALMDPCETVLQGNFRDGKLHGFVKGISLKEGILSFVGRFQKGRPVGNCWKAVFPGLSWLYGTMDSKGTFSGDNNAFIYTDLSTVLLGAMGADKIVEAYECSITGYTFNHGVMNLQFSRTSGPHFRFRPSSLHKILCPWMQEDPYEHKTVYARQSSMGEGAGDGLFLRRDVPAGTVVAFYNGIRIMPGENPPFRSKAYQIFLDWKPTNVPVRMLACLEGIL